MRRLLRNSKKRNTIAKNDEKAGGHTPRIVEPDEEVDPSEGGRRVLMEDGRSAIRDPEEWAKRRSLSRTRSGHSLHSALEEIDAEEAEVEAASAGRSAGSSKSVKSSKSSRSRVSRASYDDVFSDEVAVESILNPDGEVQIDADSDDYETYDVPRPGTKERAPRAAGAKTLARGGGRSTKRLSARITKFISGATSAAGAAGAVAAVASKAPAAAVAGRKPKGAKADKRSSKRLSFRRSVPPEKQAARAAKVRAKQEADEEKRRLRELKKNPWYPAGVDFRFLSPKPVWVPYLGRKASSSELDFGDEARLVGSTA